MEKKSVEQEVIGSTQEENLVVEEPLANIPLTQELFDVALPQIVERFKQQGRGMELAILGQPMRVEGDQVVLEVMGTVQEEIGNKLKPELIKIIRELTGANRFTIELLVKDEVVPEGRQLYTSTDKLNYLLERHAALAEFQRRFGLETDF